jgi:flagellar hook-associated protein 2
MSSVNFLGSYSGIDQSMIDDIMEAERIPLTAMNEKVDKYETEQTAWQAINTSLNSLNTKIEALSDEDLFSSKSISYSGDDNVSVEADDDADEGIYKIEVTKLAESSYVYGEKVTDASGTQITSNSSDLSLAGELNIHVTDSDTAISSFSINISSTDSLNDIMESINSSDDNDGVVTASIVNNRLVITCNDGGANTITIDGVNDDEYSGTVGLVDALGLDSLTSYEGCNSEFTVNGVSVTDTTNEISDVVDGLTFTLTDEGTTTITISNDSTDLQTAIEEFVTQYNTTLALMQDYADAGSVDDDEDAGDLYGDATLQRLISNLRSSVSDNISGLTGDYTNLSSLGITTTDDYDGTLEFDSSVFEAAFEDDAAAVKAFFFSEDASGNDIGFVSDISEYIEYYTDDNDGIINYKDESLDTMIDTMNDKIEAFEERMEDKEAYYIKIFAALDVYMAEAESTQEYIESTLANYSSSDS